MNIAIKPMIIALSVLVMTPSVCAQTPTGPVAQGEYPGSLSPDAIALGRELAGQGMLTQLLPIVAAKETEEMIANMPGLSDAEKDTFRATSRETYGIGIEKVIDTQSKIYALTLSIEDLKSLTEFNRSAAAARYQAMMPDLIKGTVSGLDGVDFKSATMKAFCAKTGKGCEPAK